MPFNDYLKEVLDRLTFDWPDLSSKKMFGGVGYLINGNMCLGIWHDNLVIRVGLDNISKIRHEDWFLEFDITGKPMKGWAMVVPEGWEDPAVLTNVSDLAQTFVRTLPAK